MTIKTIKEHQKDLRKSIAEYNKTIADAYQEVKRLRAMLRASKPEPARPAETEKIEKPVRVTKVLSSHEPQLTIGKNSGYFNKSAGKIIKAQGHTVATFQKMRNDDLGNIVIHIYFGTTKKIQGKNVKYAYSLVPAQSLAFQVNFEGFIRDENILRKCELARTHKFKVELVVSNTYRIIIPVGSVA